MHQLLWICDETEYSLWLSLWTRIFTTFFLLAQWKTTAIYTHWEEHFSMLCLYSVCTWNGMELEGFYVYILVIYRLKRLLIFHHEMDLEELDENVWVHIESLMFDCRQYFDCWNIKKTSFGIFFPYRVLTIFNILILHTETCFFLTWAQQNRDQIRFMLF